MAIGIYFVLLCSYSLQESLYITCSAALAEICRSIGTTGFEPANLDFPGISVSCESITTRWIGVLAIRIKTKMYSYVPQWLIRPRLQLKLSHGGRSEPGIPRPRNMTFCASCARRLHPQHYVISQRSDALRGAVFMTV